MMYTVRRKNCFRTDDIFFIMTVLVESIALCVSPIVQETEYE